MCGMCLCSFVYVCVCVCMPFGVQERQEKCVGVCMSVSVSVSVCGVRDHDPFFVLATSQCCKFWGGEDAEDALSCRSFSAKEPLIIGLSCGK